MNPSTAPQSARPRQLPVLGPLATMTVTATEELRLYSSLLYNYLFGPKYDLYKVPGPPGYWLWGEGGPPCKRAGALSAARRRVRAVCTARSCSGCVAGGGAAHRCLSRKRDVRARALQVSLV